MYTLKFSACGIVFDKTGKCHIVEVECSEVVNISTVVTGCSNLMIILMMC